MTRQRILIVDTDNSLLDVLGRMLTEHGYRVSTAGSCIEAKVLIEAHHPSCILMECVLPGQRRVNIRERAIRRGVPVVLMTGHPEEADHLSSQALPYLIKPFRMSELVRVMEEILGPASARSRQKRGG